MAAETAKGRAGPSGKKGAGRKKAEELAGGAEEGRALPAPEEKESPARVRRARRSPAEESFEAALRALVDMPLDEVEALQGVSVRRAVCRSLLLKAAGGDKAAAEWVRDTLGEKPVDKGRTPAAESVKVVLFGEV